jgi:hypothetical protein
MGSIYKPRVEIETVSMGASPVANPQNLMIKLDDVLYGWVYTEIEEKYSRQIYPVYVPDSTGATNGTIEIKIVKTAAGGTVPAMTVSKIEVLIVG